MEDSFTTHLHTITSLPASSGLQMVTTLLLALLKCSDFVIDLDGLIHSTSQTVDPFSAFHGVTMAQLSLELVETVKSFSAISLTEPFNGLILKQS
jgi:hypothetical protein